MSSMVYKKLGYLELAPPTITIHSYDGFPSKPLEIYKKFHIELKGKKMLFDIKVVDFQLDYNILMGHSYMYAMKVVSSSFFHSM
jgi:hypothetical protein